MKKLYRFEWDCGRMGTIDGLFVAEENAMKALIGKEINFGEALGKHSEVYGYLEEQHISIVNEDWGFINTLVEVIGSESIAGYNPFDYHEEEDE